MSKAATEFDLQTTLAEVNAAGAAGKLTPGAVDNIRKWLTEPRYAAYAAEVAQHASQQKWQVLDDVFWTVIPFGTGGRRGRMYPIGSNAINERTIGESAQGLATYVKEIKPNGQFSCAIAYDTRHRSREFAELCAEIMVAAGFTVYFLDDYRSTPELSYLVRLKNCSCGIMVTASHNPPSDNAVKVYWSTGGQLVPPHDKAVIQRVEQVTDIQRVNFKEAVTDGRVVMCTDETDQAFVEQLKGESFAGPRDLKVIYSPLHGVGESAVRPVLETVGFQDVEIFEPHRERNGDFPNVPGHVSNPENPAVFQSIIERARETGVNLILATDPDCDRMGAAAPLTSDTSGQWATFTGNQLAALLADFVLEQRKAKGTLSADHYLVKTLVTTELMRRIGESYGVKTYGNLLVGFKWICDLMDRVGPDKFIFGAEESHGYLVGQYARDKDGAVACLLMCELAAKLQAEGKSLHEKLEALYWQHGYHAEHLVNIQMEGSDGMKRMQLLMERFRTAPPKSLAGVEVAAVRDYKKQTITSADGSTQPLEGPVGDLVILDLAAEGNYVAVRPSGTEPKVKFYLFTFVPAELLADLDMSRQEMATRIADLKRDLKTLVETI